MENTDIMNNEIIETGLEKITRQGQIGDLLVLVGTAAAGALLWNRVVKPISRKVLAKVKDKVKKPENVTFVDGVESSVE